MPTLTYPYDPSGIAPSNLVEDELRHMSPPTDVSQPSFFVVRHGPYYKKSLEIWTGPNKTGTRLIEGTDYYVTHKFVAGSNALGKPLAGGVALLNATYSGNLYTTYQTMGGDFTVSDHVVLEELTRKLYPEIRFVTWDQLEGVPSAFPPEAHEHHVTDIKTMADVYNALNLIAANLVGASSGGGSPTDAALSLITAHLANPSTAHTKAAVGLGNVPNYGVANQSDGINSVSDKLLTPFIANYMINRAVAELNVPTITHDVEGIQSRIDTMAEHISIMNAHLTLVDTTLADLEQRLIVAQARTEEVYAESIQAHSTAINALATAMQALMQSNANAQNLDALRVEVDNLIYVNSGILGPGSYRFMVPVGTEIQVDLIGGGGGSGRYYTNISDMHVQNSAISHGGDSILWYCGSSKHFYEPLPVLCVGGGHAGNNGYASLGAIPGGAGGKATMFRGQSLRLSTIDWNNIDLEVDMIPMMDTTTGAAGIPGDTSEQPNKVIGAGGRAISSGGARYHQTYGRGAYSETRSGGGGGGAKAYIRIMNDGVEPANFILTIGAGGTSSRANPNEAKPGILEVISVGGAGIVTIVN